MNCFRLTALSEKCVKRAEDWRAAAAYERNGGTLGICESMETMLRDLAKDILEAATEKDPTIRAGEGTP